MARELRPLHVLATVVATLPLTVVVALWSLFHPARENR